MNMGEKRVAVIGAGNGGHAFAADLSRMGFSVTLFDVDSERVEQLRSAGKIRLTGTMVGEYPIDHVTGDMGYAIAGRRVLIVVVPSVYHGNIARLMAPHLNDGQVVVLNPGATGGALEFLGVLRNAGCNAEVTVSEANSMIYACRVVRVGEVCVFGMKRLIYVASLPAQNVDHVVELLGAAYPQFQAVPNVLYTSLNNTNAIIHPAPTLLNAGRIESGKEFDYYSEGITPSVSVVVEKLDGERLAIGKAFEIKLHSFREWSKYRYGADGDTLHAAIQHIPEYKGIKGPSSLSTRYIFEDIPTGLVPYSYLGQVVGVATPTMNAVVEIGGAVMQRDFWTEGRTLAKLGIVGKKADEILRFVSAERINQ